MPPSWHRQKFTQNKLLRDTRLSTSSKGGAHLVLCVVHRVLNVLALNVHIVERHVSHYMADGINERIFGDVAVGGIIAEGLLPSVDILLGGAGRVGALNL